MIRALLLLATLAAPALAEDAPRVITLGGSVTEIAVALGAVVVFVLGLILLVNWIVKN